jgi:hypothetical protein
MLIFVDEVPSKDLSDNVRIVNVDDMRGAAWTFDVTSVPTVLMVDLKSYTEYGRLAL